MAMNEWVLRQQAKETIAAADPVWMLQRGEYDPPIPDFFVDLVRGRQRRLEALRDMMLAQKRYEPPAEQDRDAWVSVVEKIDLAGQELFQGRRAWLPEMLVEEYRILSSAPLPSLGKTGKH